MKFYNRYYTIAMLATLLASGCNDNSISRTNNPESALTIKTISNRSDLISGGNALVQIDVTEELDVRDLTITLNGVDVSDTFTPLTSSQTTGLVDQLILGRNIIEARTSNGTGAQLEITNHPIGGPIFSGTQVQPWNCTTEENGLGPALDEQCNAQTQITYLYMPQGRGSGSYESYDPQNPPDDVAMTTTDDGKTIPHIIRQERGTLNRAIYEILVLADPEQPWSAINPQEIWNKKLLIAFGGGCGTPHEQRPTNNDILFGSSASDGNIYQPEVLSRGWMTAGTGMNTLNNNCNETVSAEALMMLKEHIIEQYGPVKRTVSVGGSGGSVQQHYIASAYPGLIDGIVPTQSFPDLWNMVGDAMECYLFTNYSLNPLGLLSLTLLNSAVTGKVGPLACAQFTTFFGDALDSQNRGAFQLGLTVRTGCGLSSSEIYHPINNPEGTRCSVQDYQKAIWGQSGPLNAAPIPYDNTGVQYGLVALQNGSISPEQFVHLNANIGGFNNEGEITSERSSMDIKTATTMYRAARTSDPRQLAKVPILDVREVTLEAAPELLTDMHQPYNSYVMRARLDAVNGTHDNQVLWSFPPDNLAIDAAFEVDRWLDAVDNDDSNLSREEKIVLNKPEDLVDTCWIANQKETNQATCQAQFPHGSDPRIQAGAPLRNDNRKCALKPLIREDYSVTFTDSQWTQLKNTFPNGVCDWTKPPVGYQPSIPWMTYSAGPGGQPLPPPPVSTAF